MTGLERQLLDTFQRDFPLEPRPFAAIARLLGVDEATVIAEFRRLTESGVISRIGVVVRTGAVGSSTLAAMTVPPERLEQVAALVSGCAEVNHNYERDGEPNLWFVVTAPDRAHLENVLADIEERSGLAVFDLPMEEAYHLDLGFPIRWS
jgi:DNA-binding Lrp family transcriptional regulator